MINFTVSIPTFNGSKRLPFVLDRLRDQQELNEIGWEVIVVDNNSTDETKNVVENYQANFPCVLKYCFESKQGAGFARQLAIREAQGDLIGFLDDDNIPALNWVRAAIDFAREHPQAGAIGSQIHGDFDVPPPQELKPLLPYFAISEWGNKPFQYDRMLPPSAGLVVRRQAWIECVPEKTILNGRTKDNFVTGEDIEVLAYIQRQGAWEIWYNPVMEVNHKILISRMEKAYLVNFFKGIGLSRYVTRTAGISEKWKCMGLFFVYLLSDTYKISLHLFHQSFKRENNLVNRCKYELILNSLLSPFFLYFKGYFNS
ncbi:MAG: hormogonium polysaccharide biosynthesis glycosyltransferase HpsE [Prochlorotrichaceae cyanobacterium]